jgi:DNA-binding response OmpR family regulator
MTCTAPARALPVLVVDDDPDTADSCALLLCLNGHDARAAYDGPGALAHLNGWQPAVVFLDIRLPRCSGIELRRRLCREAGQRPTIIAVTGVGTRDDLDQVRAAGFDQVLLKPVDPEELLTILQAIGRPVPLDGSCPSPRPAA